jgi:predicted small lipoprotein YifL
MQLFLEKIGNLFLVPRCLCYVSAQYLYFQIKHKDNLMKKVILSGVIAAMILGFAGCNNKPEIKPVEAYKPHVHPTDNKTMDDFMPPYKKQ